jgi:hypothetical protein
MLSAHTGKPARCGDPQFAVSRGEHIVHYPMRKPIAPAVVVELIPIEA